MSQITARGATGPLALTATGAFQSSTDANLATLVGTRWDLADGREVVLVGTSSATTTVAGLLYQDAALIANEADCAVTAFTAYSANGNVPASVVVTLGSTQTCLVNAFQGGFLIVVESTGIGQTLRIQGNTAATAANSYSTTVTLEDAPGVALVAGSSKVSLIPAHGSNVIINPTTPTNTPVGIALYAIAPSSYGFLLAKGVTGALSDSSAPGVGVAIGAGVNTAGTIGTVTYLTASTINQSVIGNTIYAATSAKVNPVYLNL